MYPKYHIIFGAIATFIIYIIFSITLLQATIIFLSSFLIDFDHYLIYFLKKKDTSLKNARRYFKGTKDKWIETPLKERKKVKHHIIIFHGIEFWIILLILAQFYSLFYYVLLGIAIHMFLDYIDIISLRAPFYTKFSQIYVYLTNKKK